MDDLPTCSLAVQRSALQAGALIPLSTELVSWPEPQFQLRRLISATPKHLQKAGPKPNPFLPWDRRLQVLELPDHAVILNKYPVQAGHLLLITRHWQAQTGWLDASDWDAVAQIWKQQDGLWFFNSAAAAGASQPHRHLQLLPRRPEQARCPMAEEFDAMASGREPKKQWQHNIAVQSLAGIPNAEQLHDSYRKLAVQLELGSDADQERPLHPYNLLLSTRWMVMVRRRTETHAGFSLNALGFGGYLLATSHSDESWLKQHGGDALLAEVSG